MTGTPNQDSHVVEGFGKEWSRFDQSGLTDSELFETWNSYFDIFPWQELPADASGFDLGCGSGRWARLVAQRVGTLHCIDPSQAALDVSRRNLRNLPNCIFHHASVDEIPLPDGTLDFGYSLGVLHHIPDPEAGIRACISKLKSGAPFLIYLYYAFDNRAWWYRMLWRLSDLCRRFISRRPWPFRYVISQIFAAVIYYPLARAAKVAEAAGINVTSLPLSFYRNRSFYVMRTDALDRFGTKIEHRFTRSEIARILERAGLTDIVFSDHAPFWVACGTKR